LTDGLRDSSRAIHGFNPGVSDLNGRRAVLQTKQNPKLIARHELVGPKSGAKMHKTCAFAMT
jgi:hypothetical protein